MRYNKIIWAFLVMVGLSSCGTNGLFTKHRYTGGFHLNLSLKKDKGEFDVKKRKNATKEENIAFEVKKKNNITPINTENNIETLSYKSISAPNLAFKKAKTPKKAKLFRTPKNLKQALALKSALKSTKTQNIKTPQDADYDGFMLILMVILALILPPVAVAIVDGIGTNFWISIILVAAAILLSGTLGVGLSSLFWLAAIIHALLIVFGVL